MPTPRHPTHHRRQACIPTPTFGSQQAAHEWSLRLEDIASGLENHGFDLASEDVIRAAEWLEAFAGAR